MFGKKNGRRICSVGGTESSHPCDMNGKQRKHWKSPRKSNQLRALASWSVSSDKGGPEKGDPTNKSIKLNVTVKPLLSNPNVFYPLLISLWWPRCRRGSSSRGFSPEWHDNIHMRNWLGWLWLGWLRIAKIIVKYLKLPLNMLNTLRISYDQVARHILWIECVLQLAENKCPSAPRLTRKPANFHMLNPRHTREQRDCACPYTMSRQD